MDISFDAEGVEALEKTLGGLEKRLDALSSAAAKAFAFSTLESGTAQAERSVGSLSSQLLQLRLNLGKLRAALSDAAAPIALSFLPAVNRGISAAARFVRSAGAVISALFGGAAGAQALAQNTDAASDAEKTLTKTATTAGKAVKRALAGFDELEILKFSGSGGSSTKTAQSAAEPALPQALTPELQAVVEKIQALLAPLRDIDLSAALGALARLRQALEKLGDAIAGGLEWAWFHVLTPLAKWVIEDAAPAAVDVLSAAIRALSALLAPLGQGFSALLTAMEPLFSFLAQTAAEALRGIQGLFEGLAQVFTQRSGELSGALTTLGQAFSGLWRLLEPVLTAARQAVGETFACLGGMLEDWAGLAIGVLSGVAEFLAGAFTGDWNRAWAGISTIFDNFRHSVAAQTEQLRAFLAEAFSAMSNGGRLSFSDLATGVRSLLSGLTAAVKNAFNGILGLVNGMLQGAEKGINAVVGAVNKLSFTVPDWVPSLGGKRFGMSLGYVSVPRVPYLAQGAVLPANRPFLAVVGDQTRGTNVEAPLATIQEAVAAVLDQGQQETVRLLGQILQAVLGIEVGDTVIGQAARRYERKMAVVTGGSL